jgi:hypothetical protein
VPSTCGLVLFLVVLLQVAVLPPLRLLEFFRRRPILYVRGPRASRRREERDYAEQQRVLGHA